MQCRPLSDCSLSGSTLFACPELSLQILSSWYKYKWASALQNQQNDCRPAKIGSAWASALGPWLPIECTAKTDQTGRMPRLIWVFTGHTSYFVGFVMRWLKLFTSTNKSSLVLCFSGVTAAVGFCSWRFRRVCRGPAPATFRDDGLGLFFLKFSCPENSNL